MAFRDIQRVVREWYQLNVKSQVESVREYSYAKEVTWGILGALIVVAAVWGYRYYANQKEAAAQVAFAESITLYREAMQGKAQWQHVEMKCSIDYEQYKRTAIAPYFLVVKADALTHQAKMAQAVEIFDTVIASMPKDSPLVSLYKTKRALIKLDASQTAAQGLDELRQLAADKENKNNDVAQYYLGEYYWARNELDAALDIWKNLVASQASEKLAASPWASLAGEKLAQRGILEEKKPIEAPVV